MKLRNKYLFPKEIRNNLMLELIKTPKDDRAEVAIKEENSILIQLSMPLKLIELPWIHEMGVMKHRLLCRFRLFRFAPLSILIFLIRNKSIISQLT